MMLKLFLCSLLGLLLAVPNTTARPVNGNNNLIEETCKTSSQKDPNLKYDFCVTSLQASPEGRAASNLRDLGLVAFNLILKNVTATQGRVTELLADKKVDPEVKVVLKDCLELYSDAVSSTNESIDDYTSKRYNDANIHLSAVMTDSTTCEDGFAEQEGAVSPLTQDNANTYQLSALGLSILTQVSA